MPLSIPLPARARIIINGAVIENSGSANISITIHNQANILRDKDVVTQAEATTPAKSIYHAVQNAYLFEDNREEWLSIAAALLDSFTHERSDSAEIVDHVRELLAAGKIYNALRASRRLIALETAAQPAGTGMAEATATDERGPAASAPRRAEIGRIRDQIAELERRISALDDE